MDRSVMKDFVGLCQMLTVMLWFSGGQFLFALPGVFSYLGYLWLVSVIIVILASVATMVCFCLDKEEFKRSYGDSVVDYTSLFVILLCSVSMMLTGWLWLAIILDITVWGAIKCFTEARK